MSARITLVLGGARSGKSRHAEALVEALGPPWTYLATAEIYDQEMEARIDTHRRRRSAGWTTREVPLALPAALAEAPGPVLVDCLTLWLSNLMLGKHDIEAATAGLEKAMAEARGPVVLVSNEVGLGLVPETPLGRAFRDAQGRVNQRVARLADRVILMVAGLPMVVK
jgi:adenosylcobinamide kinase/adenosylcobinamide-phosphate guanylyltransferase